MMQYHIHLSYFQIDENSESEFIFLWMVSLGTF
jgi:hypothetical protein